MREKKVEKIVPASAVTQLPKLLIRKDGNIIIKEGKKIKKKFNIIYCFPTLQII